MAHGCQNTTNKEIASCVRTTVTVINVTQLVINKFVINKKYVLWNVHLPNALHSVCLNRLSCTEVGICNGANSPNGFLTTAVALLCTSRAQCLVFSKRLTHRH